MVFQSLQLNVAIHEWIRHFRIRARRVVMVIAEKKSDPKPVETKL